MDAPQTNDTPDMVALDEADIASLRNYATVHLGIEVKPGTNGPSIRGKIKAADADIAQIPVFIPTGAGTPRSAPPAQASRDTAVAPVLADKTPVPQVAGAGPVNDDPSHWSHDPKVLISIPKTDDPRRPRDVTVKVNGVAFRMQRAQQIAVPYRVYEALLNGTEKAAVDGDEINPHTGEPVKVWQDVQSYPMTVLEMPSEEDVAEWKAATSAGFQKAAA